MVINFWKKRWLYSWCPLVFLTILMILGRTTNGPGGMGFLIVFPILYGVFSVVYSIVFSTTFQKTIGVAAFVFGGIFLGLLLFSIPKITTSMILEFFIYGIIFGTIAFVTGVIKVGLKKYFEKFNEE